MILTGLELAEQAFFDQALLQTTYFRWLREESLDHEQHGFANPLRDYRRLLTGLTDIHEHRPDHVQSYCKRLKLQQDDQSSCEAVYSEIIVYCGCLRELWQGHLVSLGLETQSHDLALTRPDGSRAFLEIMCVMPDPKPDSSGLVSYQTHTQNSSSSIRQKLIQKLERGQLTKESENWAVIELNHHAMVPFAVLSSLSSGYKIGPSGEGYDFASDSFFDDERTRFIRGVVYFFRGHYAARSVLPNPKYEGPQALTGGV